MNNAQSILTKTENYRLWQSNAFGNKLRAWRTYEDWEASNFAGLVVLRQLAEGGGGKCIYNLKPDQVPWAFVQCVVCGVDPSTIMINEAAPDHHVLLQGELWTGGEREGYFIHSWAKAQMRPALAQQQTISYGLQTRMLLRSTMTPSSYADLEVLIERYPDHAIEVSIYEHCLGDIPGRNSLVWEVRKY